ncbi:serine/threonine-protein kinase [uncultured Gimesia sp.]|uniref:serine/threonine-protein kinase n=1 Tax=uncultured Gimesia sp. TaxID=1678688 RepID=UPI00260E195E|nr:serine/threonine-protein kinase [uncultured Gimesia sp.]
MGSSLDDSQDAWKELEKIVSEYEDALRKGDQRSIESVWKCFHHKGFTLLIELVNTELEWRVKTGEAVYVEEYLERFPALSKDPDTIRELIETEYIFRSRFSSQVHASEYAKRFPQFGESLIPGLQKAAEEDQPNRMSSTLHNKSVTPAQQAIQSQTESEKSFSPPNQAEQNLSHLKYGRYLIKELLGEGSFGQVFLAYDPKTERNVALKIPRRHLDPDSEENERFLREARAVAALQHQNICPLFDLLEIKDRIILVMPYIEGKSLAEMSKQRKLSLNESIQLVSTLATAMAYAHAAGVIHRDLKPANILIDEKHSQPVITDFGLALQQNSSETKLTFQGQLLGTPAYLSPEQACGDLNRIGPASDIYSLGILLYELCTGKLPFDGSINSVIGQILSQEPVEPSSINSDISPALEQVILIATAKEPTNRFSSMEEFSTALEELNPTHSGNVTSKVTAPSGSSDTIRKRWMTLGIPILILTAVTGAFFKTYSSAPDPNSGVLQNGFSEFESKNSVLSEQVDLLKEISLPDDIVNGKWFMAPNGLMVNPKEFSRLTIPVHMKGNYQLELELTRQWGETEINLIFPVANKTCMLSLGQNDWCGLQLVHGHEFGKVLVDHLPNGQRHKLTLFVSMLEQQASITAKLNNLLILDWNGPIDAISIRRDWQIPKQNFGLGAHYEQVIFHKMTLHAASDTNISRTHFVKSKTDEYQEWKDLLEQIELPTMEFHGTWKLAKNPGEADDINRHAQELETSSEELSRLILPAVPQGDYQLQVRLMRVAGMGEINLILPVGKDLCMLSLGNNGKEFRIQNINGEHWGIEQAGIIVNGKQHLVEVDVHLGEGESASILLKVDQREIFHWQGKQSELSIREDWRIHPIALGLGAHNTVVRFQQVLFRNKSGTVFKLKPEQLEN